MVAELIVDEARHLSLVNDSSRRRLARRVTRRQPWHGSVLPASGRSRQER